MAKKQSSDEGAAGKKKPPAKKPPANEPEKKGSKSEKPDKPEKPDKSDKKAKKPAPKRKAAEPAQQRLPVDVVEVGRVMSPGVHDPDDDLPSLVRPGADLDELDSMAMRS